MTKTANKSKKYCHVVIANDLDPVVMCKVLKTANAYMKANMIDCVDISKTAQRHGITFYSITDKNGVNEPC